MKRMIAFCLMLCAVAGFLLGAYRTVDGLRDDVVITAHHLYGDAQRAEGITLQTVTTYGHYVWWDISCAAGQTPVTDSSFHFSQKGHGFWERETVWTEFSLGNTGGMGMSTSGDTGFLFENSGYGLLINDVASRTAPGESREETLLLEDYVDYYPLDYWMDITTEKYNLDEMRYALEDQREGENEEYWTPGQESYRRWMELFRFPVVPGDSVTITVGKSMSGAITDINVSTDNPQGGAASFSYVVVDDGMYFSPLFQTVDGTPITTGEYVYGNGLYYIPFRPLDGTSGTVQPATFDFDALELVCPLDARSQLIELVESTDGKSLHLLSQEENGYCYYLFDLEQRCVTKTVSIPLTDAMRRFFPEQELLYLRSEDTQVLVRTGPQAGVEFISLWPREMDYFLLPDVVQYQDGVLYCIGEGWYESTSGVWLGVCDEDGVGYLGLYSSNLNGTGYDSSWIDLESIAMEAP